ncbi:MAG TPA: type II and III secretion system protein family protein [Hyphomicrobiaceae bacterium]|nr:type II and III secretion system protein family protein [Hyphomicrobiaceae bacterium]
MQIFSKRALRAVAITLAVAAGQPALAQISARHQDVNPDGSVMQISPKQNFPITKKITLGVGRSMMLQFPMELRDVMIADPQKVDAMIQTSDRVFLVARSAGSTNAFFFDANGNQVMTLEIAIGSDLSALDNLLKRLLPTSNIKTDLAGTAIVLMGSVRTPADAARAADIATQFASANKNLTGSGWSSQSTTVGGVTTWNTTFNNGRDGQSDKKVINLLTIDGEDQVMLKVQVAEVQRSVLKQFGVNMSSSFTVGNFGLSPGTSNTFPITAPTLGALPYSGNVTGDAIARAIAAGERIPAACASILPQIHPSYVNNSGISGGFSAGGNCLSFVLRALERTGVVRTLAEPNLTAVSGETARFLAGGEYPVPVSSDNGAIGIQFKEFGVGVAFTPIVLSEGRISLKIDTTVSELTNEGALVLSGTQIPSLKKRSAQSTVELPSGGSIAMAGLISESTRQNVEGLPGAKDIPILGTLFRSRDFQQSETELVIIVTPYMVRPTAAKNLAKPDDGLAPASDLKANFLGHLNRVYGKSSAMPDGGLKGNYGFIVD